MRTNKIAYIFILPALLFFIVFTVYPVIKLFILSFYKSNFLTTSFVWFDNFKKLFTDKAFKESIINTILYVIIIVPCKIVLALFVSSLVFNMHKYVKDFVRFVFYVPVFASGIIISNVYKWIFHPTSKGLINQLMNYLGIENIIFFSNKFNSIIPISFIMIISLLGFDIVIYLAAMLSIKKEQIEAAKIDGCGWIAIKLKIILPQIMPVILLTILLDMIGAFQLFEYIYMLAPSTYSSSMMYDIYNTTFVIGKNGLGAAKSIVLLGIIVLVSFIKRKVEKVG